MKVRNINYENFQTLLGGLYRQMAQGDFRPRCVVGIVGNGLVPATYISQYFSVPLYAFDCRSNIAPDDISKLENIISANRHVLIVGDQCNTGKTILDVFERANEADPILTSLHVRSAVLIHNVLCDTFTPDFIGEEINQLDDPQRIVFPWEFA